MAMRNSYRNGGAFGFARRHYRLATKRARPTMKAHETVALAYLVLLKPIAIVSYRQHQQ